MATYSPVDMSQMTYTFTPIHNRVYVSFTASGTGAWDDALEFWVLKNGVVVDGTHAITAYYNGWRVAMEVPLDVTPGVSTNVKIQWMRTLTGGAVTWFNWAASQNYSHRSLIIYDLPR